MPNLERLVSNFSIKLPDRAFDPLGKIKLIVKFIHVSRRKSLDRKFRPASISFKRLSCLTLEVRLERGHFPGKQPTYPSFHLLFVNVFKFSLTRTGAARGGTKYSDANGNERSMRTWCSLTAQRTTATSRLIFPGFGRNCRISQKFAENNYTM